MTSDFLVGLIVSLKKYESREKRNSLLEDHVLIGVMGIISKILELKPELIEKAALDHGLL